MAGLVLILLLVIVMVLSALALSRIGGSAEGRARGHVQREVRFLRRMLREIPIAQDRRASLESQLDRLETRTRRDRLHLAVIGEFNSGKSTFINALLRQRILKSANVATTAGATEIRHGRELRLEVQFIDGSTESGREGDSAALAAKLERFLAGEQPTLKKLIELVTAHPEASRIVQTIRVEAPAEWLGHGICILDTPGVGAGPEYAQHHQAVTERVLADQADAAVVLIPADSPGSRTLLDFLDSTVRPFLKRCVFVITKLDGIDEEEQATVMAHANLILTRFLGTQPVVVGAGALAVLLPQGAVGDDANHRPHWREEFSKLERFLVDLMTRQGPAIIAETLVRLLHQAIEDLNSEIKQRRQVIERQQRILEVNSVARIEQVLAQLRSRCEESMNSTLFQVNRGMRDATGKFENRSKVQLGELIDRVSFSNLKETIRTKIPETIAGEEIIFNFNMQESFKLLDRQCAESHQMFAAEFEKYYQNLKSTGIPQLNRSVAAIPRTGAYTGGFIQHTAFSGGPRLRDWIGMAFRAEKKRDDLRSILFTAIESHVEKASTQWKLRFDQAAGAINAELDNAVNLHLQQYSKAVKAMTREHEQKRAALVSEQTAIEGHAAALAKRVGRLDELNQQLAASASAGA